MNYTENKQQTTERPKGVWGLTSGALNSSARVCVCAWGSLVKD